MTRHRKTGGSVVKAPVASRPKEKAFNSKIPETMPTGMEGTRTGRVVTSPICVGEHWNTDDTCPRDSYQRFCELVRGDEPGGDEPGGDKLVIAMRKKGSEDLSEFLASIDLPLVWPIQFAFASSRFC